MQSVIHYWQWIKNRNSHENVHHVFNMSSMIIARTQYGDSIVLTVQVHCQNTIRGQYSIDRPGSLPDHNMGTV